MKRLMIMAAAGMFLIAPLCSTALAWMDSEPGGKYWPPIPGNTGIESFYGRWWPDCRDAVWLDQGEIIIEPNGVLRYTAKEPYFPSQYRIIETTPYGVTLIVRTLANKKRGDLYDIWVLRYLRENWSKQDWRTEIPYKGDINTCHVHSFELKRSNFRWDFSDAELKDFWDNFKDCNPALTRKYPHIKDAGVQYWGNGWSQGCEIIRLTDP